MYQVSAIAHALNTVPYFWFILTLPFDTDAVDGMVRVADYINEMQRISETYSSLFDDMMKNSGLAEVSPGTKNPTSNIVCIAI